MLLAQHITEINQLVRLSSILTDALEPMSFLQIGMYGVEHNLIFTFYPLYFHYDTNNYHHLSKKRRQSSVFYDKERLF